MPKARSHPSDNSLHQQLKALHRAVAEQKSPTKDQVVRFCALVAMLGVRREKSEVDDAVIEELQPLAKRIWRGVGFTAATKAVFRANPRRWLTAIQVRDLLDAAGFNLRKYTFPMASVHKTLKRLRDNGLLDHSRNPFDGSLYKWRLPVDVVRKASNLTDPELALSSSTN